MILANQKCVDVAHRIALSLGISQMGTTDSSRSPGLSDIGLQDMSALGKVDRKQRLCSCGEKLRFAPPNPIRSKQIAVNMEFHMKLQIRMQIIIFASHLNVSTRLKRNERFFRALTSAYLLLGAGNCSTQGPPKIQELTSSQTTQAAELNRSRPVESHGMAF